MLEAVWKHGVLFYAVGVMCILGILSKIIVSLTLRRLVREGGRMGKSLHPLMKLVRAKFEHACMVSDKVQNIRAFVDKYMYEYKVLWIKLHSWRQMEKAAAWGCLVFGAAGAATAYAQNAPLENAGQYAAAGIAGALLLFALRMVTDESYQLEAAKNYMIEFLENTYARKYEKITRMQEMEEDFQTEEAEKVTEEEAVEEENAAVLLAEGEEEKASLEEELMKFAPEEKEDIEKGKDDGAESELVALMKEEQEKAKEEDERREKRRQDEEMIRQILAEFLT
nr:hypothetical protein [uncultured Sellimonas sp.]